MNKSKKLKQMLKHVSIATLTAAAMASPASANINAPAKQGNSKRVVNSVDRVNIDSSVGMAGIMAGIMGVAMPGNCTITGAEANDTIADAAWNVAAAGVSHDDVMHRNSCS